MQDVIIIGGGPAGLSAALCLGRLRRSVTIIDDDRPRNAPAEQAWNIPGNDGINPLDWRAKVEGELKRYTTVKSITNRVQTVAKTDKGFEVRLSNGKVIAARRLVLAYGISDQLPDLDGVRDCWGQTVLHCPFCHGFEVRDERLGVFGNMAMLGHVAPVLYGLSSDLIAFTGGAPVDPDVRASLSKRITFNDAPITRLLHKDGKLDAVKLADGSTVDRQAMFWLADLPLTLKSNFADQLGCKRNDLGLVVIDDTGKTTVEGVYAAGDIVEFSSVLKSSSRGSSVGAELVFELAHEDLSMA